METSMHGYTAVFCILVKLDQEENLELFVTKSQSMMCATLKNNLTESLFGGLSISFSLEDVKIRAKSIPSSHHHPT